MAKTSHNLKTKPSPALCMKSLWSSDSIVSSRNGFIGALAAEAIRSVMAFLRAQ
jgi:hypothetical protein